ncbi:MAG TPA: M20 family metallopeptidase [Acidimicrobiales bacterium]|jgi:amidohydrolase|nr:M20 family metallopeptidase [Acidimicrobiales bacterium]
MDPAKGATERVVEDHLVRLIELSHAIHSHPETAFEETRSAAAVAGILSDGGFTVETAVCDLPTAFSADAGSGPLVVAICAEYDALPGVGHACGHNIIAASAAGAALALARVADELGITVRVLGTPAEEGGGGKILLLERGAFDGVHAAMMVHPWPTERLAATCLAVSHFDVHFSGKQAHASAAPWEGINALDAMTVSQVGIGLLRQHLRPGDQVHGVITEGGSAANVVPASVTGRFMCRALSLADLGVLEPRVQACFHAGAQATGSSVSFEDLSPVYSHMESDPDLLAAYRSNAEHLGRRFDLDDEARPRPTLSTDMANVSLTVPTIHPLMAIESRGAVNHQPEFAAACVTASADLAVHDAAVAMAWTAIDAAVNTSLRDRLLSRTA